jgi:hypothetical protein
MHNTAVRSLTAADLPLLALLHEQTPPAQREESGTTAFSEAIARRWLLGQASRKDAQRALTDTLLRETIPGR